MKVFIFYRLVCVVFAGWFSMMGMQAFAADKKWVEFTDWKLDGRSFFLDSQSIVIPNGYPKQRQVKILFHKEVDDKSNLVTLTLDCEKKSYRKDAFDAYEKRWAMGEFTRLNKGSAEFRAFDFESEDVNEKAGVDLYRKVCGK